MTATARDVMQTDVLVLNDSDSLLEAHQFFARHDITGAPVIDEEGRLVGIVSIRDLIRTEDEDPDVSRNVADYFSETSAYENLGVDLDRLREGLSEILVSEVMTEEPVCVAPETPINEVASLIRKHRIHRVLVVSADSEGPSEIVGIISLFDLVSLLE